MEKALAFIDLLGFSSMVTKDHQRARRILSDFYNLVYNIVLDKDEIKGFLFSDSYLAFSDNKALLINTVCEIYRQCLKQNKNNEDLLTHGFFLLPRGAISIGIIEIQDRLELPNLQKNFMVSPALVHSAKLEGSISGSRLFIAVKSGEQEEEILWNHDIKTILYESNTFTFWENYKYADALWFLDLNKNEIDQKIEVESLIHLAIELVLRNSTTKAVLNQYINTLRIGILSYSKFLTPNLNDPIIDRLIMEFRNEKYWLIWLSIIELFMNSLDSWIVSGHDQLKLFFKEVSLTKGWSNILMEINKPNQAYLKGQFVQFLDEII
jgi:hypothetical protein